MESIPEKLRALNLNAKSRNNNDMQRSRKLAGMTWTEAAAILRERPVGLLPVGAIEAHGPHLPLDTDVIIAGATAGTAAALLDRLAIPSIILPPITYSVSFAGTSFSGTTPIEREAFEGYLTSLLVNAALQGYRAIICCNAHLEPAHVEALQRACRSSEAGTGIPVRSPDQREPELAVRLGDEFVAGSRHAGSYETSIVMHAMPGAVRNDELERLEPVWIDLPARLRGGASTFLDAGSKFGYFGDPRAATAAEGERLLDELGAMAIECLRAANVDGF